MEGPAYAGAHSGFGPCKITFARPGWLAVTVHPLQRSITTEENVVVNVPRLEATGRWTSLRASSSVTRTRVFGLKPVPRTVTGLRLVSTNAARA